MAEEKVTQDSSIREVYVPPMATQIIDPTPVPGQDASTDFEEFLVGCGNPVVYLEDVRGIPIELTPDNVHDRPHTKIDLESVADMISSDTINPWLDVTAADLSSGLYYDTSVNLR